MYAVIETGGKQYRVELGTEIEIDRLEAAPGETIELGRVLLLADGDEARIGRPIVDGARVSASVVRQDRGDKIVVFKYRPKVRRRVKHGHRQDLTVVRVSDIVFNDRSAAKEAETQAAEQQAARKAAAEEAARKAAADRQLAAKLEREAKAAEKAAADEQKADEQKADEQKADAKDEQKTDAKPTRARKQAAEKTADAKPTRARKQTAEKKADAKDQQTTEAKTAGRAKPAKAGSATNEDAKAEPKRPRTKKDE